MADDTRHRHTLEIELLRGSLIALGRRCSKQNCWCATGELHETPVLSVSHNGRTRTVTLREDDLDQVTAALERHRLAREDQAGRPSRHRGVAGVGR